jgi:hypothetical protein
LQGFNVTLILIMPRSTRDCFYAYVLQTGQLQ